MNSSISLQCFRYRLLKIWIAFFNNFHFIFRLKIVEFGDKDPLLEHEDREDDDDSTRPFQPGDS